MSTARMNYEAKLTRALSALGVFSKEKFKIIDVGVSGGFGDCWNPFYPHIVAYGFDPLVKEIERLKQESSNPDYHFYDFFVTCRGLKEIDEEIKRKSNDPFGRTSAIAAIKLLNIDYAKKYYDATGEGKYTDKYITIDEFCEESSLADVDLIKIDTDGHDFMALKGAERSLHSCNVLGVLIEAQFHGIPHEDANTWANIDRFLRFKGFSLFDIEIHRYSRAALPKRFVHKLPAQTYTGQVMWGDAIYFRDAMIDNYEDIWKVNLSLIKLLKLACLYEIFGLDDCTAELLIKYADRLKEIIDVKACLNLITPNSRTNSGIVDPNAYSNYIKLFRQYVREYLGK